MKKVSICCGEEKSEIYPRDCAKCGSLFIEKTDKEKETIEMFGENNEIGYVVSNIIIIGFIVIVLISLIYQIVKYLIA